MKLNRYWLKESIRCLKKAWEHRNQTTWAFCPKCGQDLCSTDSFVSDVGDGSKNIVTYVCSRCKTESLWNFDCIAPLLIES